VLILRWGNTNKQTNKRTNVVFSSSFGSMSLKCAVHVDTRCDALTFMQPVSVWMKHTQIAEIRGSVLQLYKEGKSNLSSKNLQD
jgi:hypothetical protein